ncbi:alpha/beta-hydrolase [Mollisia scopiformis]|uniref:Alpha/beta-hydrolase n=1 Tax=Mollisia scopiformis TaxID=149040 RepID=A0A194WUH7_MOLSC|nr:alpha/beta-hydrolase [Mollisia scopiformis]KUJ11618.1 alpha/beta-hydrolase [Mollisia scopiformis]
MANSASRIRPPALPVSRTCIWKTVGEVRIALDIYLPSSNDGTNHPIMLYIHGGGWIASNKTDYSRPLFHKFLALGFVIVSMDYRLLPETTFDGQLEDIRDVESWLKNNLPLELEEINFKVATDKIVVAGASAGAHLALLTPKLWSTLPASILSLYGPTDMRRVPYLRRGRLSQCDAPSCTPEVLAAATNYGKPPTDMGCSNIPLGFSTPRSQINLMMFREGLSAEVLLKGLIRGEDGALRMPDKGSVTSEEIDEISPLQLCQRIRYPPIYQVIGTSDDIFDTYHVTEFHDALTAQGIHCEKVLVPEKGHAFDVYEKVGGEVHTKILNPAAEWAAAFALGPGGHRVRATADSPPESPLCCC